MLANIEDVVDCFLSLFEVVRRTGELLRLAGWDGLLRSSRAAASAASSKGTPTAVSASTRRKLCASILGRPASKKETEASTLEI